jgi:hypothetical protein
MGKLNQSHTMKSTTSTGSCRKIALSAASLVSLLTAGCALPSREQWSLVSQRGLIPVLIDANRTEVIDANRTDVAGNRPVSRPSEQHLVRVQPVRDSELVRTPSAEMVPGRPGFVYSPHTDASKIVDVRGFRPGEKVRCPFTAQPFIVPNYLMASAPETPAPKPLVESHPVPPVKSESTVPPLDPGLAHLEPVEPPHVAAAPVPPHTPAPAPAAAEPRPQPPPQPQAKPNAMAAAHPKGDIPYGIRVAGRPGVVYSPFTGKTQLVDVAGTAPGVVVKCPYTNKLFRVPEPLSEEIKPEVFPPQPPTETASAPPVPPEKKEPPRGNAPIPHPPVPSPVNPGGALGAPPPR